jgi:TatD DNase family protein
MSKDRPAPEAPAPLFPLVDSHTHLDACGASDAASVTAIVDRAAAVGVERVVTVADDLAAAQFAVDAAHWDPRVYAAVAIHPTRANVLDDATRAEIERLAGDPRVVAVGETGLDFYWPGKLDGCATVPEQTEGFRWHIDLAKRLGKTLMIHNREADQALLQVLREEGAPETVIFHCFSSDAEMARECVDRGYYLSFAGTVTFKNARGLRDALTAIPLDRILVETDAPYLAPAPHRGATNASFLVPVTVRAMAAVLNIDVPALCRAVSENSERVYGPWGAERTGQTA